MKCEVRVYEPDRNDKPARLVAEAEVLFTEGAGVLTGLKFVGFGIWKTPSGGTFVTLPGRAFGAGQERRYFDYIRSIDGDHGKTGVLKDMVREAFKAWQSQSNEA
jgi:hypothetical protein